MKLNKFALLLLPLLSACYYGPSYAKNPTEQCPSPFFASPDVEREFMRYPVGTPMRQFYNHYLVQQKQLENYYSPLHAPTRGHNFSGGSDFYKQ